jgi:tRNA(Ile)-lysidine synthase
MSESSLPAVVAAFLDRHRIHDRSLAVALSGGIDSMVLLDILARQCTAATLSATPNLSLGAIHINHRISPNADHWAAFCAEQCARRGIPLTVVAVDVDRQSGTGLEAAARNARYAALMQSAADFVVSAQHRDDQAETVLHQMLRGTGLNGLAGMGERRELRPGLALLRPLLAASRLEIDAYAASHQVDWIEDESNQDTRFTRNFIRHELAPRIADRFPHYADALARIAGHAADSAELLEALARIDLDWDGHEACAGRLDDLPLARQVNALYHWLQWMQVPAASSRQLEAWAGQLFRPPPADRPQQAGGHEFVIRRRHNRLQLSPRELAGSPDDPLEAG